MQKDGYRVQFLLELSSHITAHRAQGQMICSRIDVKKLYRFGVGDTRMPVGKASIIYGALTRATHLKCIFMGAIFPQVREKIGLGENDKYHREVEETLKQSAKDFAESISDRGGSDEENGLNCKINKYHQRVVNLCFIHISRLVQIFVLTFLIFELVMVFKNLFLQKDIGTDQGEKKFCYCNDS